MATSNSKKIAYITLIVLAIALVTVAAISTIDIVGLFTWLTHWVENNPKLVGLCVFLVAFLESLVIVGIIVPGAVLMIGFGILVSLNKLELMPVLLWAMAGAIAGDGLSFWVGYHFKDRLRQIWPFSHSKVLMQQGEAFFARHGGKSIAFGRFVGPVRAIIPTIAGMCGMRPLKFTTVNVASAIAWAPAYVLPGVVVGEMSKIASEVGFRLIVAIVIILLILLLMQWLARILFGYLQARAQGIVIKILTWGHRHPRIEPYTRALFEPDTHSGRALIISASILFVTSIVFLLILAFGLHPSTESGINATVNNFLRSLRTPIGDQIMVAITMLADPWVCLPVFASTLVWFGISKNKAALTHFAFAVAICALSTYLLKSIVQMPRPDSSILYYGYYSFPSAHVTLAVVVYGFIAIIIANSLNPRLRIIPYLTATLLISAVVFSRLYLGVHWVADVLGGVTLALIWLSATGISYQRHLHVSYTAKPLVALVLVSFVAAATTHITLHFDQHLQSYEPKLVTQTIDAENWWKGDWQLLPHYRYDIRNVKDQPITIQFNGDLNKFKAQLLISAWQTPVGMGMRNISYVLHTKPLIDKLPVFPQAHNGRHEALVLIRSVGEKRYVLRLWKSNRVTKSNHPVYIGNVSLQLARTRLKSITYAETQQDYQAPMTELLTGLKNYSIQHTRRKNAVTKSGRIIWDNRLILVREEK